MFLSFCLASSWVLSTSETWRPTLQQSWSKQTMPSRVLKPSCRAFKMQTRFSFWR